jgi:tRNA(fMet)-specific endonuclease VapC
LLRSDGALLMLRYLLDTNVLLHVVNRAKGYELIEQRLASSSPRKLAVSVITVWEIFRMAEKAKVPTKASKAALDFLNSFRIMPMTKQAAALGGQVYAVLASKGQTIGERDSMIAGIALAHECILVTDNTKELLRVPQLVVENWRALG